MTELFKKSFSTNLFYDCIYFMIENDSDEMLKNIFVTFIEHVWEILMILIWTVFI